MACLELPVLCIAARQPATGMPLPDPHKRVESLFYLHGSMVAEKFSLDSEAIYGALRGIFLFGHPYPFVSADQAYVPCPGQSF